MRVTPPAANLHAGTFEAWVFAAELQPYGVGGVGHVASCGVKLVLLTCQMFTLMSYHVENEDSVKVGYL